MRSGPARDEKKDARVLDLKKRKLSYSEIAKIMGVSKTAVILRYQAVVKGSKKFSTGRFAGR